MKLIVIPLLIACLPMNSHAYEEWIDCPLSGKKLQAFIGNDGTITLVDGKRKLLSERPQALNDSPGYSPSKSCIVCDGNEIQVSLGYPYTCSTTTYNFTYKNSKLKFLSSSDADECEDSLESAEKALSRGDLSAAAKFREEVAYPERYGASAFDADLFALAHKQAVSAYKAGNKAKAGKIAELVTASTDSTFDLCIRRKEECNTKPATIIAMYNDMGFFIDENGNHSDAYLIFQEVIAIDPNRAVAWLNRADAAWALNKKEEARKGYAEYAKRVPKVKQPTRVSERIKP